MTFYDFVDKHPAIIVFGGVALCFITLTVLGFLFEAFKLVIQRNKPEPKE